MTVPDSSNDTSETPELFGPSVKIKKKERKKDTIFQRWFGCLATGGINHFDDSIHVRLRKDRKQHPDQVNFVPRGNTMVGPSSIEQNEEI